MSIQPLIWIGAMTLILPLYCFSLWRRCGVIVDTTALCVAWLFLWITVAVFSPFGLDTPSDQIVISFGMLVLAVCTGGLLAIVLSRRRGSTVYTEVAEKRLTRWAYIIALLLGPVVLFFLWRARLFWGSYAESGDIRFTLLHTVDSPIFGTSFMRNLVRVVVGGLLGFGSILFAVVACVSGRFRLLVVVSVLAIGYQMIEGGRYIVYQIVFSLLFAAVGTFGFKGVGRLVRRNWLFAVTGAIAVCVYIIGVSFARGHGTVGVVDILRSAIYYHAGFGALLDRAWSDPDSAMNRGPFYGRASVYGMENVALFAVRRVLPGYVPEFVDNETAYIYEYREIGEFEGKPIGLNGFYSTLYPLWADGGLLFTIAFGLGSGWLMTRGFLQWRERRDVNALVWNVFWGLFWVSSIFQSPLQREGTFVVIGCIIVLGYVWESSTVLVTERRSIKSQ